MTGEENVLDPRWAGKRLDAQFCWNPWLSLGIHIDHTDPSITLHLPGFLVVIGWIGVTSGWSLRRWSKTPVEPVPWLLDEDDLAEIEGRLNAHVQARCWPIPVEEVYDDEQR